MLTSRGNTFHTACPLSSLIVEHGASVIVVFRRLMGRSIAFMLFKN
jgi:hypothetical protein